MRRHPLINTQHRKASLLLTVITAVMAILLPAAAAKADMLVSPVRVYLDQNKRSATVILRNPSDGSRTYRLEWAEKRMDDSGTYHDYEKGEALKHSPASPYLRFSPRQITIAAKSNQTVRVDYRPPANMARGEYRSHLLFRVVSDVSEPTSVSEIGAADGMSLKLNMHLSIAIPIIVRHQLNEPPQVKLSSVELTPATAAGQAAQLAVTLQRSGPTSSFGRVIVEMQRNRTAPIERIGQADNISVYADSNQRRLLLSLRDAKLPAGAWVRVAYEGTDEYEGRLWGEQTLQVR